MAVIGSGANPKNDSSQSLKNKRRAIIEDERIQQLEKSLLAFYKVIKDNYDIIYSMDTDDSSKKIKNKILKVDLKDIKALISKYAKTKPIGF